MQDARKDESDELPSIEESQKLATISTVALVESEMHEEAAGVKNGANVTLSSSQLATVDRGALRAAGLIAPEQDERILADEYRHIKRPLIANAFGIRAAQVESGRLILVASALPGDGKTFTCINLALSLAQEKDRSVVLVDADVAKSHISDLFDLQDHSGLLDLIERPGLRMKDVLVRTDIDRLTLLPSGKMRPQATELLASRRMEGVIEALVEEDPNRIVLFDSPPLLITSESRVLAGLMGQIILIVKAGVTPQHAVEEAVSILDPSKAINLVLNQVLGKDHVGYQGSSYGYGGAYGREPGEVSSGDSDA